MAIIKKIGQVAFVLLIWGLTTIATAIAARRAWTDDDKEREHVKDILRPQDKAASVALWGSEYGEHTVSAWCGSEKWECGFCKMVRLLLGKEHAIGAAKNEQLPVYKGGA